MEVEGIEASAGLHLKDAEGGLDERVDERLHEVARGRA